MLSNEFAKLFAHSPLQQPQEPQEPQEPQQPQEPQEPQQQYH